MKYPLKSTILALTAGLMCSTVFTTAYAQDTSSGLVFYLPFDSGLTEKVSGQTPDISPGITLGEGRFGGGISANGDKSGLVYPVELLANNWPEGSAAAWVKIDQDSTNESTIITSNWNTQLLIKGGRVESSMGGTSTIQTDSAFPHSVWTHVASTWRKSGGQVEVNFYVGGQKVFTETRSKNTYPDHDKTMVAVWDNGAVNGSFKGYMDEVVFYNRRLSDADVAALHQGSAQGASATNSPVGVRDGSILTRDSVIDRTGQLSVPEEARTELPTTPVGSSEESPADRLAGADWKIVSVKNKSSQNFREIEKGGQLTLSVTLRKTGNNAKRPVRIAIRDTNETAPWNGPNMLTKYDIDTGVGKTITKDVLVSYHRRFEEVGDKFEFIIGLNNPDGTPFKDRKTRDHEKSMSFNIVEPTRTKTSELQETKHQSEGVHRRSKVAGRKGNYTIQHTSGERKTLLSGLFALRDNYTVLCELGVRYAPLKTRNKAKNLISIEVCNGEGTTGVADDLTNAIGAGSGKPRVRADSRIRANPTSRAVVGMRVCTSNDLIKLAHDRTLLKAQFVFRPFTGSSLNMNSHKKVVQFDTLGLGGTCAWRPWVYCPKDSSGQRMVATGIEAHIEDFDMPGDRNSIVGTRLMCEPLSQVIAGAE